jgi:hypothetical protein
MGWREIRRWLLIALVLLAALMALLGAFEIVRLLVDPSARAHLSPLTLACLAGACEAAAVSSSVQTALRRTP